MQSEELRRYLDRVEGNLQGAGKGDILGEIESHILDRAEALAAARGAQPGEEDLRRAMEELGDPSELAVSYSGEKYLVTPKEYAAYWYLTLLLFGVHVTMLFLAQATQMRFSFFPFNVLPANEPGGAGTALMLASLAVQAFLFDAGLVLMAFFFLRKTFRRVDLPNLTFRVETSRRPSLFRAAFALAIALLLGVPGIRDNLLIVKIRNEPESVYTLLLPGWSEVAAFILAFLALSFVKDLLYAFFRERVATVALDLAAAVAGIALFILLFARRPFLGLPPDFPLGLSTLLAFNAAMNRIVGLACILLAAIFAVRAVKRFLRLQQLWGEKDTARL